MKTFTQKADRIIERWSSHLQSFEQRHFQNSKKLVSRRLFRSKADSKATSLNYSNTTLKSCLSKRSPTATTHSLPGTPTTQGSETKRVRFYGPFIQDNSSQDVEVSRHRSPLPQTFLDCNESSDARNSICLDKPLPPLPLAVRRPTPTDLEPLNIYGDVSYETDAWSLSEILAGSISRAATSQARAPAFRRFYTEGSTSTPSSQSDGFNFSPISNLSTLATDECPSELNSSLPSLAPSETYTRSGTLGLKTGWPASICKGRPSVFNGTHALPTGVSYTVPASTSFDSDTMSFYTALEHQELEIRHPFRFECDLDVSDRYPQYATVAHHEQSSQTVEYMVYEAEPHHLACLLHRGREAHLYGRARTRIPDTPAVIRTSPTLDSDVMRSLVDDFFTKPEHIISPEGKSNRYPYHLPDVVRQDFVQEPKQSPSVASSKTCIYRPHPSSRKRRFNNLARWKRMISGPVHARFSKAK